MHLNRLIKFKLINFFKLNTIMITIAALSLLEGCASIVNGVNQSVSVETPPVTGAICSLTNNKGQWYVNNTPGSVTIHRSFEDLTVSCKKPHYETASLTVKSATKSMVFGNVLFGGAIGGGVDVADGAAYSYPTKITVPMKREIK